MPTFNALSLSTRPLILALLMLMLSARARAETCAGPQRCLHTNDGQKPDGPSQVALARGNCSGAPNYLALNPSPKN